MSNKQEATYGPIPDGPGRWMTDAEVEELRAEVERLRVQLDVALAEIQRYRSAFLKALEACEHREAEILRLREGLDVNENSYEMAVERAEAAEGRLRNVGALIAKVHSLRSGGRVCNEDEDLYPCETLRILAAEVTPPAEQRAWRDRQGDIWTEGDDGLMSTPETTAWPREHVEKKWGPLVKVDGEPRG